MSEQFCYGVSQASGVAFGILIVGVICMTLGYIIGLKKRGKVNE